MDWYTILAVAGLAAWGTLFPLGMFWSIRQRKKLVPKPVYHRLYLRGGAVVFGAVYGLLCDFSGLGFVAGVGGGFMATSLVKIVKGALAARLGVPDPLPDPDEDQIDPAP